jgi:hypothetical protein
MSRSFKHSLRSRVATKKYIYLSEGITLLYQMSRSFKHSLRSCVAALPLKNMSTLAIT